MENTVQQGRTQMTIVSRSITCCFPQATEKKLSEYEISIAFQLQQWLCESASLLRLPPLPALWSLILQPCTCH
jgi:hypothetical protein